MDQLRAQLKKNKLMIRHDAPVTIESTRFEKLSKNMEQICIKIKKENKL